MVSCVMEAENTTSLGQEKIGMLKERLTLLNQLNVATTAFTSVIHTR